MRLTSRVGPLEPEQWYVASNRTLASILLVSVSSMSLLGCPPPALAAVKKPASKAPVDKNPALSEANALSMARKYTDAIQKYKIAVEKEPGNYICFQMYGRTLAKMGMIDEAIEQYKKGLKLKPSDAELYNDIGVALVVNDRPGDGARFLKRATQLMPKYIAAYNNLGVALQKIEDYVQAKEAFTFSIKLQPTNAQIQKRLQAVTEKLASTKPFNFGEPVGPNSLDKPPAPPPTSTTATTEQDTSAQNSAAKPADATSPDEKKEPSPTENPPSASSPNTAATAATTTAQSEVKPSASTPAPAKTYAAPPTSKVGTVDSAASRAPVERNVASEHNTAPVEPGNVDRHNNAPVESRNVDRHNSAERHTAKTPHIVAPVTPPVAVSKPTDPSGVQEGITTSITESDPTTKPAPSALGPLLTAPVSERAIPTRSTSKQSATTDGAGGVESVPGLGAPVVPPVSTTSDGAAAAEKSSSGSAGSGSPNTSSGLVDPGSVSGSSKVTGAQSTVDNATIPGGSSSTSTGTNPSDSGNATGSTAPVQAVPPPEPNPADFSPYSPLAPSTTPSNLPPPPEDPPAAKIAPDSTP